MRKVQINVNGTQVAAFKHVFRCFEFTFIIKKTKSGHYFSNAYANGKKVSSSYVRSSGKALACGLGISLEQLNAKLFDSTLKIQLKKRSRMFGLAA